MKKIASILMFTLLLTSPLWAQSPSSRGQGDTDFGRSSEASRLQAEHSRESRTIGTISFVPVAGGFDLTIDKSPMNPYSARVYLDGKKLKNDQCRGDCSGMIKVSLLRTIHGNRHQAECHLELSLPMSAQVFIPPAGGLACNFMLPGSLGAMTLATGGSEPLPAWELALKPQAFVAVGDCLDQHERATKGFADCVQRAGIETGPEMTAQAKQ